MKALLLLASVVLAGCGGGDEDITCVSKPDGVVCDWYFYYSKGNEIMYYIKVNDTKYNRDTFDAWYHYHDSAARTID